MTDQSVTYYRPRGNTLSAGSTVWRSGRVSAASAAKTVRLVGLDIKIASVWRGSAGRGPLREGRSEAAASTPKIAMLDGPLRLIASWG